MVRVKKLRPEMRKQRGVEDRPGQYEPSEKEARSAVTAEFARDKQRQLKAGEDAAP